jgi:hypothetical protein
MMLVQNFGVSTSKKKGNIAAIAGLQISNTR